MKKEEISLKTGGKINGIESLFSEMGLEKSYGVHQHLLTGNPMTMDQFVEIMQVPLSEARELISLHGELDEKNMIVGFIGISLLETKHKMFVNGINIYTWCAADTILFPGYLGFSAIVESIDPISNEIVKLSVSEYSLDWTEPIPLFISLVDKANSCDIRNSFCNNSFFFSSKENADKWLENNPGANIGRVEDILTTGNSNSICC
jgi:alkylmercury lyase